MPILAPESSLNPCFDGIWYLSNPDITTVQTLQTVLILVLMGYGIGVIHAFVQAMETLSLNPCFDGIWYLSWLNTQQALHWCQVFTGLNPCFDGIWYLSPDITTVQTLQTVLILVLMGYGIGEQNN